MTELVDELTGVIGSLASNGVRPREGGLPDVWETIVELGLLHIGIAEERGGSGGELEDLLVVCTELARKGITTPFAEASTAAWVSQRVEGERGDFETILVSPGSLTFENGCVSGEIKHVPWAPSARGVVLLTEESDPVLVDLRSDAVLADAGGDIAGIPGSRIVFTNATFRRIPDAPSGDEIRLRLGILRASELIGVAQGAFDLTREYVSTREQFDAPLLNVPAVASSLALMSTYIEQALAARSRALACLGGPMANPEAGRTAGAIARVMASTMASAVAGRAHQLHGAMGVTDEYPLHHFTRKLWTLRDRDESEFDSIEYLGNRALACGEAALWDEMTSSPQEV